MPLDVTFEANADYSGANGAAPNGYQFTFVGPVAGVATGPQARVAQVTASTFGAMILQNKPKLQKGAVVRICGFSKLAVDGTGTPIVVGSPLKPGAAGMGNVASVDDYIGAIAFEPSSATVGEIIEVLVVIGAQF